jgi:D-glycero-beta-D-manno-heptose-7-phosphate kinase
MMKTLKKYLDKFEDINVVVIGDLILDKYIFGKVERISPEAPVPIVKVEKERYVPGGAANAANNVTSMTGNAFLLGIVGNDIAKNILFDVVKSKSINTTGVISVGQKPTIQKIRVLGQNQQLLRIDYEDKEVLDPETYEDMISNLKKVEKVDIIIMSDYAKGTLTKKVILSVKEYAKKKSIPLVIDPKPKNKHEYTGSTLITPNKKEAEEMSNMKIETKEDLQKAGTKLMEELNCNVLITRGEKGMSLFEKGKQPMHIPTLAKEVYDVSGAGDTVVATLALAFASGSTLREAANLANHAAGIKVGKLGTAPVSLNELRESIDNHE